MKKCNSLKLFVLCLFTMMFMSCSVPFVESGDENYFQGEQGKMTVSVEVGLLSGAKYAMPSSLDSNVKYFGVLSYDSSTYKLGTVSGSKVNFNFALPDKNYSNATLTVYAVPSSVTALSSSTLAENVCASGSSAAVSVVKDQSSINFGNIVLTRYAASTAKGAVDLTYSRPANTTISIVSIFKDGVDVTEKNYINITATWMDASKLSSYFSDTDNKIPAGVYTITFSAVDNHNNDYPLSNNVQIINVFGNMTTNSWYTGNSTNASSLALQSASVYTDYYICGSSYGWYGRYTVTPVIDDTATGGSLARPFSLVSKAAAKSSGSSLFTYYVDGSVTESATVAVPSKCRISGLSSTAGIVKNTNDTNLFNVDEELELNNVNISGTYSNINVGDNKILKIGGSTKLTTVSLSATGKIQIESLLTGAGSVATLTFTSWPEYGSDVTFCTKGDGITDGDFATSFTKLQLNNPLYEIYYNNGVGKLRKKQISSKSQLALVMDMISDNTETKLQFTDDITSDEVCSVLTNSNYQNKRVFIDFSSRTNVMGISDATLKNCKCIVGLKLLAGSGVQIGRDALTGCSNLASLLYVGSGTPRLVRYKADGTADNISNLTVSDTGDGKSISSTDLSDLINRTGLTAGQSYSILWQ